MSRIAAVVSIMLIGLIGFAAPIPKTQPVIVQTPLRDGLKKVIISKSNSPHTLQTIPDLESTFECVKTLANEEGTRFELKRTDVQNGLSTVDTREFLVNKNGEKFQILKQAIVKSVELKLPAVGQTTRVYVTRDSKNATGIEESLHETKNEGEEVLNILGKKWVTTRWTRRMTLDGKPHETTTWSTSPNGPGEVKSISRYLGITIESTLKEYISGK